MNKPSTFWRKVMTANGQAQIVSYAFWGALLAGMLWDFCDECLPNWFLAIWGVVSFASLPVAIWGSRPKLKQLLILDMVLSSVVLSIYVMHEPHYVSQMIYNVKASGEYVKIEQTISDRFSELAIIWMMLHSAYLANLFQRQELELERLRNA
jgi:hypothetical protein